MREIKYRYFNIHRWNDVNCQINTIPFLCMRDPKPTAEEEDEDELDSA